MLYTRLAPYFRDCLEQFCNSHGYRAHIFHYSPNPDAPLEFESTSKLQLYDRGRYRRADLLAFAKDLNPDCVLCVGWSDSTYNYVCRHMRTPTISMIDNPYTHSLRQRVLCRVARRHLLKTFSHAWVCGRSHYMLMRKAGFPDQRIIPGLYCASAKTFSPNFDQGIDGEKRILYAGRLLDWKGVEDLVVAFMRIPESERNGWKLRIAGTGPLAERINRIASQESSVKVLGFLSPEQLAKEMKNADAFCLPSWHEHWGVVVHEAALSGLLLVLSTGVEAASEFLIDGYNGYSFEPSDTKDLETAIRKLISTDDLSHLKRHSRELGERHRVEHWCQRLLSVIQSAHAGD
ncbi:Glycogen synthase [Crateriforma conspicua]|nr:Glycogen synthase [Crateriforma conspicua]